MEEWRDIEGYEGIYQVSSKGRIKSKQREVKNGENTIKIKKESIRCVQVNKRRNGYCEISLHKDGKEKRYKVHRLVAQAFIPNELNKSEVNHKDGNKENNCVENLEWVTSKENSKHAWDTGLANANHKKVKVICKETGEVYESVVSCANILNIDKRTLFRILKGERKSTKGLTFERFYEQKNIEMV